MFSSTPSFHHHYRMAFPMWIATLGKRQEHRQAGVKRRRRVYDLNHAVVSPMLQRELGDIAVPEASKLLGLVRLWSQHLHMTTLDCLVPCSVNSIDFGCRCLQLIWKGSCFFTTSPNVSCCQDLGSLPCGPVRRKVFSLALTTVKQSVGRSIGRGCDVTRLDF
jgi:hypothetical protein